MRPFAILAFSLFSLSASAQIAPIYVGTGSRYDQQIGAHARNTTHTRNGALSIAAGGSLRRIYVRFLPTTDRDVTGFDLQMRAPGGQLVTPASLWDADASDRPRNLLVDGHLGISTSFDYRRASLRRVYRVTGNQLYFVAFDLPAGQTVELGTTSAGEADVAYFTLRTGTVQFAKLMYKVNANGSIPTIATTAAVRGTTAVFECRGLQPDALGLLWIGLPAGDPLPRLAGSGYVRGAVQWSPFDCYLDCGFANLGGTIRTPIAYGTSPSLIGLRFFAQWEAEAQPWSGSWVLSNAVQLTIQ